MPMFQGCIKRPLTTSVLVDDLSTGFQLQRRFKIVCFSVCPTASDLPATYVKGFTVDSSMAESRNWRIPSRSASPPFAEKSMSRSRVIVTDTYGTGPK